MLYQITIARIIIFLYVFYNLYHRYWYFITYQKIQRKVVYYLHLHWYTSLQVYTDVEALKQAQKGNHIIH